MADQEHLSALEKGVEDWNHWQTKNLPTGGADLIGSNLSGRNLCGVNFGMAKLQHANLINAKLNGAHLGGANLSGARLKDASLVETDLTGAVLLDADLSRARFGSANLNGAILTRANLEDANFSGANLRGADLRGVYLHRANLSDAELSGATLGSAVFGPDDGRGKSVVFKPAVVRGANFQRATFLGTFIPDVDLSEAVGLDVAVHLGPSVIGLDTFFRSTGKIPEAFLRGVGVPDTLLQYAASLTEKPFEFYSCFISYSHADKTFARLLHDRLQGYGIRCWLDEHQLLPGDDLHEGIDQGIRLWDKVLLCASKSSLTSWWVDGEITRAFQKEAQIMKERGKRVVALIPMNLDGFLLSDDYQSGKKAEIKSRAAANFLGWDKDVLLFDRELEKVVRALRTDAGSREKPPPPKI